MKFISMVMSLFFVGCASLGPQYSSEAITIPKSMAMLTVYRPWKYVGSAGDPYTCLDDKAVGEFYNGTY